MASKDALNDARILAAAQAVTAPKPYDPTSLLSAGSGAAAAEASRQKMLAQVASQADAASSARYTGLAYNYFAEQKAQAVDMEEDVDNPLPPQMPPQMQMQMQMQTQTQMAPQKGLKMAEKAKAKEQKEREKAEEKDRKVREKAEAKAQKER
jgi:hypothetical protein